MGRRCLVSFIYQNLKRYQIHPRNFIKSTQTTYTEFADDFHDCTCFPHLGEIDLPCSVGFMEEEIRVNWQLRH